MASMPAPTTSHKLVLIGTLPEAVAGRLLELSGRTLRWPRRFRLAGRDDLVAVEFASEDFGSALRWEASRGGAQFPHLYADLPVASALGARRLMRSGGSFAFGASAP
jgi:hypothetical protein